ncbi:MULTISPECIES: FAD:protein FMN transferase [Lactobacillus]|uniref:FAD:protein FMN transferase n=1 Tax=Lactobacillus TaxID=1578 RepID=UPI00050D6401|nr:MULTISPECIES: FAD:protein FMN transferase [Lactobacillus]AIS08595.1 Thiamin biosynthesis lipoprotein ApbE [Lactobacillus sp. wkB8]MBC6356658.1 FAD:protein FMN transferase [Lactobacillus helsingborgensis]MBI0109627.1 FAD:protein FMN transferase [Lactobacillus sp. W8093]MCT6828079.1 FAD:protein FMN transferase [Lactobacillus helsingborgensis]UZX31785.1 FAD:protein FMN transferase [Lactobacillus helsingborgensis]
MIKTLALEQQVGQHHALGTSITLQVFGARDKKVINDSFALIDHYEDILTVNRDESEVMDVNHAAGKKAVQVSSGTYDLIKLAVEESRENFGFNALIGPIVKLWSIGFKNAHVPEPEQIKERMKLIDPYSVDLNDLDQTVYLKKAGMELDLGGIAKGWIADRIRDLWRAYGVHAGIINLGGNILLVGDSPKRANGQWSVGVQDPKEPRGKNITSVMVPQCSAVTSGTYERYLEVAGHKYHHLIDPRTGYPVETNLAGVTTFTKDSVEAEIECKRLFFAGKPLAGWHDDPDRIGAIFVYNDEHIEYDNFQN